MNPNWWLVLLAFVLGIVFTLLWSLRRVKRRVAETTTQVRGVADDSALAGGVTSPAVSASLAGAAGASMDADLDADTNDATWPDASAAAALVGAPAGATTTAGAGGVAAAATLGDIKGNRDSMLYHTTDSPWYGRTKAEEWFTTEAQAQAAGYTRWDRDRVKAAAIAGESVGIESASAAAVTATSSDELVADGAADDAKAVAAKPAASANGTKTSAAAGAAQAASGVGDIKGNRDSMLYHTTDSPWYGRTKAEEWFTTEAQAQAAGYTRWDHGRAKAPAKSGGTAVKKAPTTAPAEAVAAKPRTSTAAAKDAASQPATTKVAATKAAASQASGTTKAASAKATGGVGDIKGNKDSMLYHTTDSPWYGRTKAEEWFTTEAQAVAAGYTRWDHGRAKAPAKSDTGAAKPKAAPAAKPKAAPAATKPAAKATSPKPAAAAKASGDIKGNRDSMLYHTTDSPWYGRTKAEEWFTTEAQAVAAGYTRWDHKRTQR